MGAHSQKSHALCLLECSIELHIRKLRPFSLLPNLLDEFVVIFDVKLLHGLLDRLPIAGLLQEGDMVHSSLLPHLDSFVFRFNTCNLEQFAALLDWRLHLCLYQRLVSDILL